MIKPLSTALLLVIAACGGGGDAPPNPPPPPVPQSGVVDPSYGDQGKVAMALGGRLVVAPDGSVYLTGSRISKLDSSGHAVLAYGGSGSIEADPHGLSDAVVDSAGNLYVTIGPAVAKFDREGRPVTSWGSNGRVSLFDAGHWANERIGMDAAGNAYVIESSSGFVAKVDSRGLIAPQYGLGGIPLRGLQIGPAWIAVARDGSAFVAGGTGPPAVVGLRPDGSIAFQHAYPELCAAFIAHDIAADLRGNAFLVGRCEDTGSSRALALKVDATGSLGFSYRDPSPGLGLLGGGAVRESLSTVLAAPDGSFYLGGYLTRQGTGCTQSAIVKLDAEGRLVTAFGGSGVVRLSPAEGHSYVEDLGMDGAGRIYVTVSASQDCFVATDPSRRSRYAYRLLP